MLGNLLHAPTVLLVAGFSGFIGCILLGRSGAFRTAGNAGEHLSRTWFAAALVQAAASCGNALRGQIPDLLVIVGINPLQLLTAGLLWFGARQLNARPRPVWVVALAPAGWLAACLVPQFLATLQARVALFMVLGVGMLIATMWELLSAHRRAGLRSALDLAVMIGLMAAVLVASPVGTAIGLVSRGPDGIWAAFNIINSLAVALFSASLPFLILSMSRERERAAEGARRAAALEAGRAEVQKLHDGLPALIFLSEVQPDGTTRLVYLGGDIETVTGWPETRLRDARLLDEHVAPGDPLLRDVLGHTARDGLARADWRLRQEDGGFRHMRSLARVHRRLPGGVTEVVGYTLDVTAERLAASRAMAAARLASIGELGAGLAHEIKQPLQALSLGAELATLALRRGDTPGVEQMLDTVVMQAQRAAAIVEHVRSFASGAPAGTVTHAVSLAKPVEGALVLARASLAERGIKVTVSLGASALQVLGEEILLEQVLLNLLTNARDAMAECPPGAPRELRITAAATGDGWVELRVADTGGGIAPEILPRLFEPFATTKGPDRGLGLGLAVSHGLVRSLGGTLSGHNTEIGAIFTVRLPEAQPSSADPAPARLTA